MCCLVVMLCDSLLANLSNMVMLTWSHWSGNLISESRGHTLPDEAE